MSDGLLPTSPGDPQAVVPEGAPRRPCWTIGAATLAVVLSLVLTLGAGLLLALALAQLERTGLATGARETARTAIVGVALVLTYVGYLVAVRVAGARCGVSFAETVRLGPLRDAKVFAGAGVGVAVGARAFAGLYAAVLAAFGVQPSTEGVDLTRLLPLTPLGVSLALLIVVILGPFAEEVVFRGVLLSAIRERWGESTAIAASAAIFGAIHFNLVAFVPLAVLGAGLGALYVRSKSLWPSVLCHATFNALGLIGLYILKGFGVL